MDVGIHDELHALFPHGHPDFIDLMLDMMALHNQKNHDYARGGDPLGNFDRVASILSNYDLDLASPTVVALVYMLKQLDAALWMLSVGYEGAVEGVDKRLEDVGVYAVLVRILHRGTAVVAPVVAEETLVDKNHFCEACGAYHS